MTDAVPTDRTLDAAGVAEVRTWRPEFLAACWTSAGDVMPLRGPDTSPWMSGRG